MRIFLDHCVPKRLMRHLFEHEVKTAYQMGWAAKKNGELLKLVEKEFEAFITVDQNLRHQQNLASFSLKFIILVADSNQYEKLAPLIPQVKEALPRLAFGEVVEISIAMMGDESFIGVPIIHKAAATFCRVMTQTQADAVRVETGVLPAEFNRGGKPQDLLLRAAHVIETQIAQAFSCNLFHSNYQRVCRALLVTGDCLHSDAFELTHEDMSIRLGKHRNRISTVATDLQKRSIIDYDRRGQIAILDRKGLERSVCECYRIVKESVPGMF